MIKLDYDPIRYYFYWYLDYFTDEDMNGKEDDLSKGKLWFYQQKYLGFSPIN